MAAGAELVHATAVAIGSAAVLIRGPSGSGKSDLALRCLALSPSRLLPASPELVADDQVLIAVEVGRLVARAPAPLRNLIEVRGLGLMRVPATEMAVVRLVADLVPGKSIERLPEPGETVTLGGHPVPLVRIAAFEGSAPIKLMLALQTAAAGP